MYSLSLIVLLIFSSNSRGNKFMEISPIGVVFDDQYEYSEDGVEGTPVSGGGEEYPREEEYISTSGEDFNTSGEPFPTAMSDLKDVIPEGNNTKITYDYNYYKPSPTNESKPDQVPKRRDLNNWRDSEGNFEMNNYNSRDGLQEYYDDSPYVAEKYISEVGGKRPQYYQKNYYYNYYPYRRYLIPNALDRRGEITGQIKPKRLNPCKQYLEFLRYAFQKLDRNMEYQYDYNEYDDEWRDVDLNRNPSVFGTRMYGPTLYVDNSGKAYQFNNKHGGVEVDEGVPLPRNSVTIGGGTAKLSSTTPISPEGGSQTTVPIDSSTDLANPNLGGTEYDVSGLSTEDIHSGSETISPVDDEQTEYIKNFHKWWNKLNTDTSLTTETIPFNREDSLGETKTTFEELDFYMGSSLPTTTNPSNFFNPDDYDSTVGSTREKAELDTSNSTFFYWSSRNYNSENTTLQNPPSTANSFSSKSVITFDTPARDEREEADCDYRMLPCPDTVNITYPLNGYCNRYVSCESGRAIRRTCPDGLHFNIIIKSCDIPHNSFCTYSCPEPRGYFGIPGDCSGYFFCKDSVPEYRMCPPRMHWDPQRSTCTFAELSSCPMKCFKANEVKHYEGDCKAYIVCLNGLPFYHKCPPNTKFDRSKLSCVPDKLSNCEDNPKLLTKTLNPTLLCKDIEVKLGTKTWCSYFTG